MICSCFLWLCILHTRTAIEADRAYQYEKAKSTSFATLSQSHRATRNRPGSGGPAPRFTISDCGGKRSETPQIPRAIAAVSFVARASKTWYHKTFVVPPYPLASSWNRQIANGRIKLLLLTAIIHYFLQLFALLAIDVIASVLLTHSIHQRLVAPTSISRKLGGIQTRIRLLAEELGRRTSTKVKSNLIERVAARFFLDHHGHLREPDSDPRCAHRTSCLRTDCARAHSIWYVDLVPLTA